jgi:hypothetical protein
MFTASRSLRIFIVVAIALLALVSTSPTASVQQEKPLYKLTGGEATLVGTISFDGEPPQAKHIDTSADPVCLKMKRNLMTEWVVVTDGKLSNVVVYVWSESLKSYSFAAPSQPVTLQHKGCRFEPHVLGMQAQQTLRVVNADATAHNTHPAPKANREWNQSQPPSGPDIEQRFERPELFIPFRDNQHPWEKAYVSVFEHPFFAVTGTDGSFRISGLPPGKYVIVAWHEKFGEKTVEAFLAGSEQREQNFTFRDSESVTK